MRKKIIAGLALAILFVLFLSGCNYSETNEASDNSKESTQKLQVIATIFPQYDFARQIGGDKIDVSLLLPPGVETHSFDPRPSDIIKISNSDLFIYTGKYMESWAEEIIDGLGESNVLVLDASKNIELIKTEETHNHSEEEVETENEHLYDPHIWTSPLNAKIMVDNIADALIQVDPENENYYLDNAASYKLQLDELDAEFSTIVEDANRNEIIFGGRFAFLYFTKQYGLEYESAYDSCASESEPSVKKVSSLIEEIKEKDIPVIYYEAMIDPKIAKTISEETGAEMLLFHSCHTVSKEDLKGGVTYLSLMKQNAKNLRKGLM